MSTNPTPGVHAEPDQIAAGTRPIPLGDRLLIMRDERSAEIRGIIIGKDSRKAPSSGRVVSVGPGRILEDGSTGKMEIRPQDRVFFAQYAGTPVQGVGDKEGEERYVVLRQDDLLFRLPRPGERDD